MNQLEKVAINKKKSSTNSSKKNPGLSTKKQLENTLLINPTWEWENNPEYDEFWKNN